MSPWSIKQFCPVLQIELRLLVWTSSTGWAEASQTWAETAFSQLDMPALEESIAAFAKKLLRMERGLPSNQVGKLRTLLMPCVSCMSNERDTIVPRSCLTASQKIHRSAVRLMAAAHIVRLDANCCCLYHIIAFSSPMMHLVLLTAPI